jgi:hypothetical protein
MLQAYLADLSPSYQLGNFLLTFFFIQQRYERMGMISSTSASLFYNEHQPLQQFAEDESRKQPDGIVIMNSSFLRQHWLFSAYTRVYFIKNQNRNIVDTGKNGFKSQA